MKNYSLVVKFFYTHFMNSFIYLYILETVRKNRFTSNATDSEICNVIKDWFRFAGDREGGGKSGKRERKQPRRKRKETVIILSQTTLSLIKYLQSAYCNLNMWICKFWNITFRSSLVSKNFKGRHTLGFFTIDNLKWFTFWNKILIQLTMLIFKRFLSVKEKFYVQRWPNVGVLLSTLWYYLLV